MNAKLVCRVGSGRGFVLALMAPMLLLGASSAQSAPKSKAEIDRERVRLKVPPLSRESIPVLPETHKFVIPDGTPIRLRLAQPVRGMTRSLLKAKVYSREGDVVRLVVSDDVRVNGMVVISKGAIGEATVTKVQDPGLGSPGSGGSYEKGQAILLLLPKAGSVSLQLDWVESVTGEEIPLRALPTGESKPFVMSVSAERGGMIVRPAKAGRDLHDFFTGHLRNWAPTGSRVAAYVDGRAAIDLDDLKQAQELFPVPPGNGIVTIYRTNDRNSARVPVSCDNHELGTLGGMQYLAFEIAPGKHTCRSGQRELRDFVAEAGERYFLHLRQKNNAWGLELVDVDEGEDSTANGQLVEAAQSTDISGNSPTSP